MVHHPLGAHALVVGVEEAERAELGPERFRIALHRRPQPAPLGVDPRPRELLVHPEVDERDTTIAHEQVVAGVRIGREVPGPVEGPDKEAVDDLREAVAVRLRQLLHLVKRHPVDPFGHQDPLPRQARDHGRDVHEGVPAPVALERPVSLGLELIVALVHDPLPDLARDRLRIDPWRDALREPQQQSEVLQISPHGR